MSKSGIAFLPTTVPVFTRGSSTTGPAGLPVPTAPDPYSGFLPRSWWTGVSSRRRRSRSPTSSTVNIWTHSCTGFDSIAASGTRPSNITNGAFARYFRVSATNRGHMTPPGSGTRSWAVSKPPLADRSEARRVHAGCTCASSARMASAARNSSTRSRRSRDSGVKSSSKLTKDSRSKLTHLPVFSFPRESFLPGISLRCSGIDGMRILPRLQQPSDMH